MRPATLEAWQIYAERCRRLDNEEAKAVKPWWASLTIPQIVMICTIELGSLALLNHLAKMVG
jgi:hypothetical protein